jgi:hypothetical protein
VVAVAFADAVEVNFSASSSLLSVAAAFSPENVE